MLTHVCEQFTHGSLWMQAKRSSRDFRMSSLLLETGPTVILDEKSHTNLRRFTRMCILSLPNGFLEVQRERVHTRANLESHDWQIHQSKHTGNVFCPVVLCSVVLCCAPLCCTVLRGAVLCSVVLCYAVVLCPLLGCATLLCCARCCVVLCCVVLHCAVFRCVVLHCVITKKVHFWFTYEYRGTLLGSSCGITDDAITMKIFFLA